MSTHIQIEPGGFRAKLWSHRLLRRIALTFIRDHLRIVAAYRMGWGQMPSWDEGQPIRIDLCRRCCRRLERML